MSVKLTSKMKVVEAIYGSVYLYVYGSVYVCHLIEILFTHKISLMIRLTLIPLLAEHLHANSILDCCCLVEKLVLLIFPSC